MDKNIFFKTFIILISFFLYSCNQPLPIDKLFEHKTYLDINEALLNQNDVYMLTLNDTLDTIDIKELIKLDRVQRLDITSKINIDTFPDKLTLLRNLQWIQIKNNSLKVVDYQIQHFPHLTILDLSNNKIEEFPIWLCYNNDKFFSINLSYNEITDLPREIENLKSLTILNLAGNQIEELPLEIGELKNLSTLILFDNKLEELPYTLTELYSNLKKLYIGGNPIAKEHLDWLVKHLPYTDIDTNNYVE